MKTVSKPSTHPLILIAAVSVSIASLAAAANFAGLLPSRSTATPTLAVVEVAPVAASPAIAPPAPAPVAASTPAPAKKVVAKAAPKPAPVQQAQDKSWRDERNFRRVSNNQHTDNGIDVYSAREAAKHTPPAPPPLAAQNLCRDCGTVESVRETTVQSETPNIGLGAIAGGVLGGLLGNQTGGGNGKKAMTVLGAVG